MLTRFYKSRASCGAAALPAGLATLAALAVFLISAAAVSGAAPRRDVAPSGPVLAEAERVYLAEIEHRALIVGRKGFATLTSAIKSGESAQVARFFATNFTGQILEPAQGAGVDTDFLRIRRVTNATNAPLAARTVQAPEFARYLTGLWKRFKPDATIETAVMNFSPVNRQEMAGVYKGRMLLRFAGVRTDGQREELITNLEIELAAVPDADAIPDATGWIRALRFTLFQEATAKHELMTEVARQSGIDVDLFRDNWKLTNVEERMVVTGGVFAGDVDDDGYDDLLVTDANGLFLFRGLPGGRFEEVTVKFGLPRDLRNIGVAAIADFDNDGFPDILLDYRVYRNVEGKRFENITEQIADRTAFRFGSTALGLSIGDYDRDGLLDIYVSRSNGPRGNRYGKNSWIDGPGGPGNQLWHNLGNWKFEEVSQKANAQAGRRSVFTSCWLDANNDGWPDIYSINEFGGGALLLNQTNGTFRELPLIDDLGDFGSMGMAVGDYDNDGNIDVYACNMSSKSGRRVFENLSSGTYPAADWAKIKRFVTGSEMYRNAGGLKF
ncbi:MAG: hypothetical protein QOF48_3289, partial [Verrucomicrobiota bacterium]